MYNPFDGLKPGLGPFAKYLGSPIQIILALVWAVCFAVAAAYLITSALAIIRARRQRNPHAAEEAGKDILAPLGAVLFLALAPVIYKVIVDMAA